uniref:Uncharacterized protein n=1 Tax=Chrysemys picta bellii TaxID=8478 RepID=A0A8C3FA22_CHRPI
PVSGSNNGLIEPKKLPNPVRESKTHQELHRELLFSHRRLLPEHKPELQKVLETRRFKQLKQQQESQRPLTDLEEELRKRHRKLEQGLSKQAVKGLRPSGAGAEQTSSSGAQALGQGGAQTITAQALGCRG